MAFVVGYFGAVWTGCQISAHARIGPRLIILHPSGIVIGANAVLGSDCMLVGRNTIGQRDCSGIRPVLGDGVWLGAGACVLGAVTIGDRVRIGPNAIVMESVPSDCTVTCAPAPVRQRGVKQNDETAA